MVVRPHRRHQSLSPCALLDGAGKWPAARRRHHRPSRAGGGNELNAGWRSRCQRYRCALPRGAECKQHLAGCV